MPEDRPAVNRWVAEQLSGLGLAQGEVAMLPPVPPPGPSADAQLAGLGLAARTAQTAEASTVPEPHGKPGGGLWGQKGLMAPPYIEHVAGELMKSGHPESDAYHMAVGIVENWAKGHDGHGSKVHPDVQAAAVKNIAAWERLRAEHAGHASRAFHPGELRDRMGKWSASGTPGSAQSYDSVLSHPALTDRSAANPFDAQDRQMLTSHLQAAKRYAGTGQHLKAEQHLNDAINRVNDRRSGLPGENNPHAAGLAALGKTLTAMHDHHVVAGGGTVHTKADLEKTIAGLPKGGGKPPIAMRLPHGARPNPNVRRTGTMTTPLLAYQAHRDETRRAAMSTQDINDLPDSAFAYIEPGGTKDSSGKTVPRDKRHFPLHDDAHIRNALQQAPKSPFADKAMPAIKAAAVKAGIGAPAAKDAASRTSARTVGGGEVSRADAPPYKPAAYHKDPDETRQCPACDKYNSPDAAYCAQCGKEMPGTPAAYKRDPDENVQCPRCGKYNDNDSSFCDQCGLRMAGRTDVKTGGTGSDSTGGAMAARNGELFRYWPLEECRIMRADEGREYASGRVVEAYAAVFDQDAEIKDHQGHYLENILPTAFDQVLRHISPENNGGYWQATCLYNHAMTVHGTPAERFSLPVGLPLVIASEGKGLLTRTEYAATPLGEELLELVNMGALRSQSFTGGIVRSSPQLRGPGDRYGKVGGTLQRVTRHVLGLREYGLTPFAAYSGAEVLGVRMQLPGAFTDEVDDAGQTQDGLGEFDGDAATPTQDGGGSGGLPEDGTASRSTGNRLYQLRSEEALKAAGINLR